MTALVLFLVLLGLLSQALGFVPTRNAGARGGNAPALTPTTRSMFGGGGSKAKAVTIKVEGKTITPATSPCNLRKELISAGVGTYFAFAAQSDPGPSSCLSPTHPLAHPPTHPQTCTPSRPRSLATAAARAYAARVP